MGDLSVAIPEHKGLFRSEDDEVSQLTSAFTNYMNHLVSSRESSKVSLNSVNLATRSSRRK